MLPEVQPQEDLYLQNTACGDKLTTVCGEAESRGRSNERVLPPTLLPQLAPVGTCDCDNGIVAELPGLKASESDQICTKCNQRLLEVRRLLEQSHSHAASFESHSTEQDIAESFNSLAVSNSIPHLPKTCRQEFYAPGYHDDTTVDDLAGYFDTMMHLPRPMSDMAELMYT